MKSDIMKNIIKKIRDGTKTAVSYFLSITLSLMTICLILIVVV